MFSKFYSRSAKVFIAAVLIWTSLVSVVGAEEKGSAKNVILLIPDGMGISYLTATRIYKGEELSFERYVKGLMKTASADTNVTDSAAAGTAMATGYKTNNGVISVTPDGVKPDSILDAARESGKSTGLVATSRITHATPAVFTAHDPSRGNEVALATEYINNVDVILGGGRDMFLPESEGGKQPERNLVEEAKAAGYEYITNRSEIGQVDGDQILGLFAMSDLKYEIDRDKQNVPSLAEMTKLAVDTLSKNDKGFFLMVEGSQIDWAGHANDPIALITDMLAFEEAVDVALEFARENSDTLVVVVGDHETGGMNIGNTPGGYQENIAVLKNATGSVNTVGAELLSKAITTDVGSSVRVVNHDIYMPLREVVDQLDGKLDYNGTDLTVDVEIANSAFTVNLPEKSVKVASQEQESDFFVENGTAYFNLKSIAELIGLQVAYGQDEDGNVTTAYWVDVKQVVEPIVGFKLTEEDVAQLTSVNWNNATTLINEVGTVVSGHALISWGSRHHTGEELPLYAYGKGANEFVGLIDNTNLPRILSYLMGVELFENEEAFMQELEKRRNQ
ncbi:MULTISPECIES: alkaline phosphatase [Paenibacillus]|uniref:Alkaline phosphatase n=1 Tax=Paenibacillus campinasensis TaxID=66347 RepID=A0A268EE39_9BACL|nr:MULTISPECIES: alkaline phosphatase [Paenibacillus]PAD71379.1 alkaline phosphatase [Paenibacillus campinasensis]PAK50629.1 alkaline phosphatase [Paenibacillus sp. 7541]